MSVQNPAAEEGPVVAAVDASPEAAVRTGHGGVDDDAAGGGGVGIDDDLEGVGADEDVVSEWGVDR